MLEEVGAKLRIWLHLGLRFFSSSALWRVYLGDFDIAEDLSGGG